MRPRFTSVLSSKHPLPSLSAEFLDATATPHLLPFPQPPPTRILATRRDSPARRLRVREDRRPILPACCRTCGTDAKVLSLSGTTNLAPSVNSPEVSGPSNHRVAHLFEDSLLAPVRYTERTWLPTGESLEFAERRLRAAMGNGLLTCGGHHSRDRETLGRFSTTPNGPFRTPQRTGSEPRLSETGAGSADLAKKGGNEGSREVHSRLRRVNAVVDRITGKTQSSPRGTLLVTMRADLSLRNAGFAGIFAVRISLGRSRNESNPM